ncbi:uncharacterized protein [Patagioenas fasciata]|uniref:uncharacterized protein n=1 Tax=Patagioenas fasciata TaxID=372321 RepID=UPI003A995492
MPLAAPASGWRGSSGSVAGEGTGEHVPCVDGGCCCWSQRGWGEVKRKKCGAVGPTSASCGGRESEPLSPGGEGSLCAACGGPGANVRGRVRARILERDGCLASEPARLHVPEASSRRSPDTPPCSPRLRTAERPELPERKGGEKETGASELLEASWQPLKARAAAVSQPEDPLCPAAGPVEPRTLLAHPGDVSGETPRLGRIAAGTDEDLCVNQWHRCPVAQSPFCSVESSI